MTDIETSLRETLAEVTTHNTGRVPPVERVYAGARRRQRRRLIIRTALVVVLAAAAVATALVRRSDTSRLDVANPSAGILTPRTARLLPKDTLGFRLSFVQNPADATIDAADRTVTVQLWGPGDPQLAIRTSHCCGFSPAGATEEMVSVAGWESAELLVHPSGATELVLDTGSLQVEIASRTLGRGQLLAIAASLRVRDGGGVNLDASTIPTDFTPLGEDSMQMEPLAYSSYTGQRDDGGYVTLDVSVASQTAAGRAFERLVDPPSASALVGNTAADLYRDTSQRVSRVVWVAARDVAVQVTVAGLGEPFDVDAALQVARSIRAVDEATWRKTFDAKIDSDGATPTTTLGGGSATTR